MNANYSFQPHNHYSNQNNLSNNSASSNYTLLHGQSDLTNVTNISLDYPSSMAAAAFNFKNSILTPQSLNYHHNNHQSAYGSTDNQSVLNHLNQSDQLNNFNYPLVHNIPTSASTSNNLVQNNHGLVTSTILNHTSASSFHHPIPHHHNTHHNERRLNAHHSHYNSHHQNFDLDNHYRESNPITDGNFLFEL